MQMLFIYHHIGTTTSYLCVYCDVCVLAPNI